METPLQKKARLQLEGRGRLNTRQHRLRDYLEEHFVSGKFFTIEEIVANLKDSEGNNYYELNTNPYKHDKCVLLAHDIKRLNSILTQRYKVIVKDENGGCKLAESREEVEEWLQKQREPIEIKSIYLNTIQGKLDKEGTLPFINQANRVLEMDEIKPIEVFKR